MLHSNVSIYMVFQLFLDMLCVIVDVAMQRLPISRIKFVIFPIFWIVGNIILYCFKWLRIADYMIIKKVLPIKIYINKMCIIYQIYFSKCIWWIETWLPVNLKDCSLWIVWCDGIGPGRDVALQRLRLLH